jgi:phosphatidylserine/phosphatidylglycerophosphate/cardiolipin synthase-like enzyme
MIAAFSHLDDASLRGLGRALRSGRLSAPITSAGLARYCPLQLCEAIAGQFQKLLDEGMRTEHLAFILENLAEARTAGAQVRESVDLVWSGPEVDGTINRDTRVVLRELYAAARESVLIVGYAVYQGRDVFRTLAERMDEVPALRVRMFLNIARGYRDTTVTSELLAAFLHKFRTTDWPGQRFPEIYYDPRSLDGNSEHRPSLHAKCVVIDRKTAFVTSANFTEAAQTRNIEVGALIQSERFATQLADHFEALTASGILAPLAGL